MKIQAVWENLRRNVWEGNGSTAGSVKAVCAAFSSCRQYQNKVHDHDITAGVNLFQ
jgi:hypothetical protein